MPVGTNPMVTRSMASLMTEANGYTVGANILINGTNYAIRTATADGGASLCKSPKTSGAIANGPLHFEQHHRPNDRCFDRVDNWR